MPMLNDKLGLVNKTEEEKKVHNLVKEILFYQNREQYQNSEPTLKEIRVLEQQLESRALREDLLRPVFPEFFTK